MRSKLGLLDVAAPPRPEEISFGGLTCVRPCSFGGAITNRNVLGGSWGGGGGAVPELRDPTRRLFQGPQRCGGGITVVLP